jgi:hypothetical protein
VRSWCRAESWWGGRLACLDGSLARYVVEIRKIVFLVYFQLRRSLVNLVR